MKTLYAGIVVLALLIWASLKWLKTRAIKLVAGEKTVLNLPMIAREGQHIHVGSGDRSIEIHTGDQVIVLREGESASFERYRAPSDDPNLLFEMKWRRKT